MEEVEISGEEEDVEVIPLSPLRRLEERIRQIEHASAQTGTMQLQGSMAQIFELVKANQKMADEIKAVYSSMPQRQLQESAHMENLSSTNQSHELVSHMDDLVKSNQRVIEEMAKANSELKGELERIPQKIDELLSELKDFMALIKTAGEEGGIQAAPDISPVAEQLQKITDQNQKVLESNQELINSMDEINKKIKSGTPVSQLLSAYPKISVRGLEKRQQS